MQGNLNTLLSNEILYARLPKEILFVQLPKEIFVLAIKYFSLFSQRFKVTVSNIILLIPSGPREQSMLESKRFKINDQVPI